MDCRQALTEAKGDLKKAKEWLKTRGAQIAAKKEDRKTKIGLVEAYIHSNGLVGALVKLGCETDFVAQTKEFKKLAHELAMQVVAMKPQNVKELTDQDYIRDPQKKIADLVKEVVAKTGENVKIKEIARLEFGEE